MNRAPCGINRVLSAVLVIGLFFPPGVAAAGGLAGTLSRLAESPYLEKAAVGLAVLDTGTGRWIAAHGADTLLVPASNQKLFVTAAALLELGDDFRFTTTVYAYGRMKGGTLDGYLCVRGGGDPCLSGRFYDGDPTRPLVLLARQVRAAGIREVTGALYVDDSLFDREFFHPSWPRKQAHRWYAAEVGALSVNDNCITVTVTPLPAAMRRRHGARGGKKAACSFVPFTSYLRVVSEVRTVRGRARPRVSVSRHGREVRVSGTIGEKAGPFSVDVAVHDPGLFAGSVLGRVLAGEGIRVAYVARVDPPPPYGTCRKVAELASPPLREVVRVTNARSQNFFAEMLLKYLGSRRRGTGSFASGRAAVREILSENGFDLGATVIDDGSGLSRRNRVSARTIARLLAFMAGTAHRDAYVRSLAVPADPFGTLRKRLRGTYLRRKVHAKTGYIAGVKAVSGYVEKEEGGYLVFSFLVNGYPPGTGWRVNALQDTLLKTLANE